MNNDILISLIDNGFTYSQISKQLNIPTSTLQHRLKKLNLKTKLAQNYDKKCEVCDTHLIGKQQKFCSKQCKMTTCYKSINLNLKKRRKERRDSIIELKGGKCIRCGYSKCNDALHFHHREPELKKFELSRTEILNHTFDIILEEVNKCDLLCANCHAELHSSVVH
jgi:hypothetical protein